jgi:hypothetical protein
MHPALEPLTALIGHERDLDDVARALRHAIGNLRAPVCGALQLTCSDESEAECVEALHRHVVRPLLPSLKFASQAAFRTANLGARYEWGSARLAEQHFATPASERAGKVMLIKINTHVSRDRSDRYGQMQRYQVHSSYCGALYATLEGTPQPAARELEHILQAEGLDRLDILRHHVGEDHRLLAAALASARLQARMAVLDLQEHQPATPTVYLVVPCVTLNRPDLDTELVVGVYLVDRRRGRGDRYLGLGDDPRAYHIRHPGGRLHVGEAAPLRPRPTRDHRQEVLEVHQSLTHLEPPTVSALQKETSQLVLDGLVAAATTIVPETVALYLFARGLVGIHNVWRAHALARGQGHPVHAEQIIREFRERLAGMPPAESARVLAEVQDHLEASHR